MQSSHRGRPWLSGLVVVCTLAVVRSSTMSAQTYVTARDVFLRRSPSNTGAKLGVLDQGDTVSRRANVAVRPGWLPVRTQAGKAGWVGTANLRAIHIDSVSDTTATANPPIPAGAAASRIDTSWEKPPIVESTISIEGGAATCGPLGDDVDDGTNFHKDRADTVTSAHAITVDAIRSLPDTALWRFTNRKHWTKADSALVIPYEGVPVTVEGYFEIVKPQAGNTESPNCHSSLEQDTDWHMALVADPSETEERAVVVEPTPRVKRNHPGWTPAKAEALAVRSSPAAPRNEAGAARVRVTGFLMLDPVHPAHIRGDCKSNCASKPFYRATLWEVHPVTRIEVLRNGSWVPLDSLP